MSAPQEKKVILITGCSSGFGLLMAARLSSRGHRVFATMRNITKQDELLTEVKKRGGKVDILKMDVTDPFSVKSTVAMIKTLAGRIDVLINNAGYGIGGFFEDLTDQEIRDQMNTNFFGAQNVCREVIPLMRQWRSGHIINVTSIAGLNALPAFGAYNASKWALEGFSESLFYEMKLFNIRVSVIEPGTYKTKIFFENSRYAKNFNDPKSPYYEYSQRTKKTVDQYVNSVKEDPEEIAALAEKLINSSSPPFRNIPDTKTRILYFFRRALPFRLYSWIVYKTLSSQNP